MSSEFLRVPVVGSVMARWWVGTARSPEPGEGWRSTTLAQGFFVTSSRVDLEFPESLFPVLVRIRDGYNPTVEYWVSAGAASPILNPRHSGW